MAFTGNVPVDCFEFSGTIFFLDSFDSICSKYFIQGFSFLKYFLQHPLTMTSALDSHIPPYTLHPLHLLDKYLESTEIWDAECSGQENDNESTGPKETKPAREVSDKLKKKREELLRAADFLYGGSSLESALIVLDTDRAITQICATPSNRKAYLVQGTSRSGHGRNTNLEIYFCLFEPISPVKDAFYYCSCRSFFERAKSDQYELCKHLLALKLMPHLGCSCNIEQVSDSDFANLLMRRVFDK